MRYMSAAADREFGNRGATGALVLLSTRLTNKSRHYGQAPTFPAPSLQTAGILNAEQRPADGVHTGFLPESWVILLPTACAVQRHFQQMVEMQAWRSSHASTCRHLPGHLMTALDWPLSHSAPPRTHRTHTTHRFMASTPSPWIGSSLKLSVGGRVGTFTLHASTTGTAWRMVSVWNSFLEPRPRPFPRALRLWVPSVNMYIFFSCLVRRLRFSWLPVMTGHFVPSAPALSSPSILSFLPGLFIMLLSCSCLSS
ncbi:hypothetical protein QBC36DRAFT_17365 [Triangularia setosa]|uniref:Uncharacterized protein n=1 Tax=Triangularia setosa TaxID=2587417 RepID=A0AAN6W7L8_9PEZI|nr:hypothetical protein QBC36DRAFT_17365 [Podospora setosa]